MFTRVAMALPVASVLQQKDIETTVLKQSLGIVQSVTYIPSIPMKVQHSGNHIHHNWRLFYEVPAYFDTVRCSEAYILIRKAQSARSLHEYPGTVWLLGIIEQRVLVVIDSPDDHYEQENNDHSTVHPVQKDQDENGCPTDTPKLPEKEHEYSAECLGRAEAHVPV